MPKEVAITIAVILAVIVLLGVSFLLLYRPVKRLFFRKNYVKAYYRSVSRIVRNNDFYLVNSLDIETSSDYRLIIDHLIGGNKFLYLVIDYYYEGEIDINPSESVSIIKKKDGSIIRIANPLDVAKHTINRFSSISGIKREYLVGIILTNEESVIITDAVPSQEANLVKVKGLAKFIEGYERKEVTPFVKRQLWQIVQDLHHIKEHGKTKTKNNKPR